MVEPPRRVSVPITSTHHKDSDPRSKGLPFTEVVVDTLQPMVKPGEVPRASVRNSRRRAKVDLSVNAVPLFAVNPRAHDEIDRDLEAAAQNLVVRRRIAAPRVAPDT